MHLLKTGLLVTIIAAVIGASSVQAADAPREFEYPEPKLFEPEDLTAEGEEIGWLHTTTSPWWLAGMIGVATLILWTAKWVDADCHKLALDAVPWNLTTIGVCLASLAAFVLAPPWLSLPASVAVMALVVSRYVRLRNKRVLPSRQLFTPAHRAVLRRRFLGWFGVKPKGVEQKLAEVAKKYLPVTLFFQSGKVASPAEAPPDERDPSTAVKELMGEAAKRHVREITLVPRGNMLAVAFKIDGLVHAAQPIDRLRGAGLVQMVKHLADLNSPQPLFRVQIPTMHLRLTVGVTVYGEGDAEEVELIVCQDEEALRKLNMLGLTSQQLEVVNQSLEKGQGLITVASPPEMGSRTTVYAMLDSLDPFSRNIVTFERPPMPSLASIEQNDLTAIDRPLAEVLTEKSRQDYDLMVLGEVPDKATALMALTAPQRGQLFVTRHEQSDAVGVVKSLVSMGVGPDAVASGLSVIVAQRLVRLLCEQCRTKVAPSARILQRLHLNPDDVPFLYEESAGCETCGMTGFQGRIGFFEVWRLSDESRELIAKGADVKTLRAAARSDGTVSLQQTGLKRVLEGKTSLRELARALKIGT